MSTSNSKIGLKKHARSPGSIINAEHHDPTGAGKGTQGYLGTIKLDIAGNPCIFTDTVVHAVDNYAILKVANTTGAFTYLWIGDFGDEPATPGITNAFAIPPNSTELIFVGASDIASKAFKSSSAALQVIVIES